MWCYLNYIQMIGEVVISDVTIAFFFSSELSKHIFNLQEVFFDIRKKCSETTFDVYCTLQQCFHSTSTG